MFAPQMLPSFVRGARLSRAFREACRPESDNGAWVGVEHEFLAFDAERRRVDFRTVIHELALGRRDLVPGDTYAYRLVTGSVVTADTTEAEIATPPVELGPGFASRLDAWAAYERSMLATQVLPVRLVGDSTHLNVEVPKGVECDRIADLFATRFAAGLMLLMDRPTSPGLLVRPRPSRLELGGEYVVGDALRASLAYAVGGTLACIAWLRGERSIGLPPELDVRLERGVLRYGWYVDRRAFGVDLYAAGRASRLVTVGETALTAQQHLERAWSVARAALLRHVRAGDLLDGDRLVSGSAPLPIERAVDAQEQAVAPPRRPRSPFGLALRSQHRRRYDLAPVMLSWQAAVFLAYSRDGKRAAFLAVPGSWLGTFVERLRGGHLDDWVEAYLALRPAGRRISNPRDVRAAGLCDELGLRLGLLAAERNYHGQSVRYRLRGHSVPAGVGLACG